MLKRLPEILMFAFLVGVFALSSCTPGKKTTESAPKSKSTEEPVYEQEDIDQSPLYEGTETALMQYMALVKLPLVKDQSEFLNSFTISFIIEKDGSVSQLSSDKDEDHPWVQAYLNHLKGMGTWTPAQKDGKAVRSRMVLPIRFGRRE